MTTAASASAVGRRRLLVAGNGRGRGAALRVNRNPGDTYAKARPREFGPPSGVDDGMGSGMGPLPSSDRNSSSSGIGGDSGNDGGSLPAASAAVPAGAACGPNGLRASSLSGTCQIVASWRLADPAADDDGDGLEAWSCSAFRVGATALATAGHCLHWGNNSRYTTAYAESVDVYCAGNVCSRTGGRPVARGLRSLASPRWEASGGDAPSPWDWAVIETSKTLPGASVRLGAAATAGGSTRRARLSGYPDSSFANDAGPACASRAYAGGCRQHSSSGTLRTSLTDPRAPGYLTSSALSLCPGQSGGPVVDARTGRAVAVVSGYVGCLNLFAPHVVEADAEPATCERAVGGSSVPCLWRRLTEGAKRDVVG